MLFPIDYEQPKLPEKNKLLKDFGCIKELA